jgi:hypothetical protein
MEKVDLIASGYEWACPECGTNNTCQHSSIVACVCCEVEFEVDNTDHCWGN